MGQWIENVHAEVRHAPEPAQWSKTTLFNQEWGKRSSIFFNLPNILLQIVLACTANPSYELISPLNCIKEVENTYFLTAKKNYSNSECVRTSSEGTQFMSPTQSTSHSLTMKQGMTRGPVVKLVYMGTCTWNLTRHLKKSTELHPKYSTPASVLQPE